MTTGFSAEISQFGGSGLALQRGQRLLARGLGFTVAAGEALLLTGPNGSGKSSLLRVMAGLSLPRAGRLEVNGAALTDRQELAGLVGWLGHADAIKPALTVAEHLAFHRALGPEGLPAGEAAEATGLTGLMGRFGRMLSAGQRRRLSLARLLVRATPLWLLDEPTNALDADGVSLFRRLAGQHLAAGGLLVAATHLDLGLAAQTLRPADFAP
jgi:heme exporter protein A